MKHKKLIILKRCMFANLNCFYLETTDCQGNDFTFLSEHRVVEPVMMTMTMAKFAAHVLSQMALSIIICYCFFINKSVELLIRWLAVFRFRHIRAGF